MGQGRFGHDRILSGVIVCHVVGNNGVFPERGSRGPCVGFWVPGSIWQRMWYFCAKFLWIKGVFYHGLCVIIYAGRIVPCLHWHLIRVIGRMTSLEWFSIWETSNNIINFNDVRKRLWKLVSMMMFSPCVFCVLPCVTSTFTVSRLARIIKQASRVGGCERVFTLTPPHPTSLLYYPSESRNRKGTGHTRKNTENTRWKHHHWNKFSQTFSDIIKVNDIVTGFSNRKPL